MIDALIADAIRPGSDGRLRAVLGPVVIDLQTSIRDEEKLLAEKAPIVLFCRLETADETISLLGFHDEERRGLYDALREVSGIGRQSALNCLACGEAIDILRAVSGSDEAFFRQVPGLGPVRIKQIVAHLGTSFRSALPRALEMKVTDWIEQRDSLMSSGMSFDAAEASLRQTAG